MSEQQAPCKTDIAPIFKRLRSLPSNKVCFDCGAKNPTWASVTYGVFICIDCSAIHRSLGVHLSFVRSTQLDTTWTWLQLRGMQVGGNANAMIFFQQHNCSTTDTQQKYNSRAAQLYREKLTNLSVAAMKLHGTKPIIDVGHSEAPHSPEVTDVDFFKEHSEAALFHQKDDYDGLQNGSATSIPKPIINRPNNDTEGPSIEAALSISPTEAQKAQQIRKSTIGARRAAASKGMGGVKKGLGAQKVATDFSEIEKEAQRCDQLRAQVNIQEKQVSKAEEEKNMASVRLAYQDLSFQQKKTEEKLRQTDPKKAAQLERLGMGFSGSGRTGGSGVSHSAASDMKVIQQENPMRSGGSRSRDLEDDFEFVGLTSGPPKYGDSPFMSRNEERNIDKILKDTWDEKIDRKGSFSETILPLEREENTGRSRKGISHSASSTPSGDEAQKKFGNAKSISSEQFFGGGRDFDYERRANLAKFEGSSSISSADYFSDGSQRQKDPSFNSANLYDIKEGVKDGVSKVAGRLSSLANGVMSSLQERYGY